MFVLHYLRDNSVIATTGVFHVGRNQLEQSLKILLCVCGALKFMVVPHFATPMV